MMTTLVAATAMALPVPSERPWTLVAGGDLMLNGISPKTRPLRGVANLFRKADIAYANLEIPLTNARTITSRKSAKDIKARNQFVLRADPGHIAGLAGMGLDAVSLGNNHGLDYGPKGLNEMTALLDRKKIQWTGAGKDAMEAERPVFVRTKNGVTVGFISYLAFMGNKANWTCSPATGKTPGVASLMFNGVLDDKATKRIQGIVWGAKSKCDVLAVALHWGLERQTVPTAYQMRLGEIFRKAGADIILGAHPHVLQGYEVAGKKPVLYSLGNLVSPLPASTAIYELVFDGTTFKKLIIHPAAISGGRVTLRTGKNKAKALSTIAKLNAPLARMRKQLK